MSEEKNILRKIGDGIVDVAPTIGALLTGTVIGAPAGAAMNALGALGRAFGLGNEATPTAVATAILSDPEARLKVMQVDNAFKLAVMADDTEKLKIQLADVQSSRQRETSIKDNVNKILAYAIVGGFLALIGATLLGMAKVESALAGTLVGYLSAKCEQVLAYYFGSSRGSDKKTDLLAKTDAIKG